MALGGDGSGRAPRVLVVSYHYDPSPVIGAVRWTALAHELRARGWNVRALTASEAAEENGRHIASVPVVADRVSVPPERLRAALTSFRARFARPGSQLEGSSKAEGGADTSVQGSPGRIRRELAAATAAPDGERRWVRPALARARTLVQEWRPDVLVTTGPPHSTHLVGRLLHQETHIPWVADLRDPIMYVPDPGSWVGAGMCRLLERSILRRSSRVITTAPLLSRELRARHPGRTVVTIPNGVRRQGLPPRPPALPEGLVVSHVGSIYLNRDPALILRGFSQALARRPSLHTPASKVQLMGHIGEETRVELLRTAEELGLEDHVEVLEPRPRAEALALVAHSTVAVVLAQFQPLSIPGKLYESVALGVPTLVVAEVGSASWEMAVRVGAHRVVPGDVAGATDVFLAVAENPSGDRHDGQPKQSVMYDEIIEKVEAVLLEAVVRRTRP